MLWGTGSLRSGTLSLSQMLGGQHEPGMSEYWPFYWLAHRSPADIDAGEFFVVRLKRNASVGTDLVGDVLLKGMVIRET